MRGLLLSVVVLDGLAYVGRQYGREISLLFGTSTGAVSRAERPNAGARSNLEIFNGCGMEGDACRSSKAIWGPETLGAESARTLFKIRSMRISSREQCGACRMRSQRIGATRRNVRYVIEVCDSGCPRATSAVTSLLILADLYV